MKHLMKDENGLLTFEWILLITLLVIGIIGGISVIRDALIIEAAETAGSIVALSQDYAVTGPLKIEVSDSKGISVKMTETTGNKSSFTDEIGKITITGSGAAATSNGTSDNNQTNTEDPDPTNTDPDNPTGT